MIEFLRPFTENYKHRVVGISPQNILNQISHQVVCSKCEAEFRKSRTNSGILQEYTKLDIGFTDIGMQVWCRRYDANVVHVNFEGNQLKSDFRCLEPIEQKAAS